MMLGRGMLAVRPIVAAPRLEWENRFAQHSGLPDVSVTGSSKCLARIPHRRATCPEAPTEWQRKPLTPRDAFQGG
jgi:hypothetical protein